MAKRKDDFTGMTGAEALDRLTSLKGARQLRAVRGFLYTKHSRPKDLPDQLLVLEALSQWPSLSIFDRSFALVASAHKACELVDVERCRALLPRLGAALGEASGLPPRAALRMDRTHLVFSILNVAMNLSLLVGDPVLDDHARRVIAEVEGLDPRRTTGYLYNSSSNILKTLGLALLVHPDRAAALAAQMQRILYIGVRANFAAPVPWSLTRLTLPRRLEAIDVGAAFREFEGTMRRFGRLQALAQNDDPARRAALLHRLADACVGQAQERQKQAMMAAVSRTLAPRWEAPDA